MVIIKNGTKWASIPGHRSSSCPSWRNSYQWLLRYKLGRTDRWTDRNIRHFNISFIILGFTFYGVIIVNQCVVICCLCLWMKSITSWWHTQCVKYLKLIFVWFDHSWAVLTSWPWLSAGYWLAISWLLAGYQIAIVYLSAGHGLAITYQLAMGWL